MSKSCSKCKLEKSFEHFHRCKRSKTGYVGVCKDCINKKVFVNDSERICNKCNIKKSLQNFNLNNKKLNKYDHTCRDCQKEVYKNYTNKLKLNNNNNEKNCKICDTCNIEKSFENFYLLYKKINIYESSCKKCCYDKITNKNKQQKKERYKNDIEYKIKCCLRSRLKDALHNNYKIISSIKLIGCSIEYFKNWISYQFEDWMSWENYGEWQLDHVKPCASFDMTKIEEQQYCFHWKNYRPLSKELNNSKGDKIDDELIKQHKILSDNYEKNIIE